MRILPLFAAALLLAACTDRDADYTGAMADQHAGETPAATPITDHAAAPDVATSSPVYARFDGAEVTGFLARPVGSEGTELPGLVVIHEWWGLNDNIQEMTRRLADQGYVALAVDLYGEVAADSDRAQELMRTAMDDAETSTENLRQAVAYLRSQEDVGEVGVIGWCFGGAWSLRTALAMPGEIDAAVIYYGQLETDRARLATLDMPILGIFGAADEGIPVAQVRTFEQTLRDLGKDAEIHVYEGADHAFANPSGERYDAAAAEDAWAKTLAFLYEHLKDGAAPADTTR